MCAIQQWDWSQWHCRYRELAAELFASVMTEKKTSRSPSFSPFCLRTVWWHRHQPRKHLPRTWLQRRQIFTFLAPKVPRPMVLLLVIGHWYKIQFLGPIEETRVFLYIWLTFPVDCDIYNHIWAQAWSVLCEGQQPLLPRLCLLLKFYEPITG